MSFKPRPWSGGRPVKLLIGSARCQSGWGWVTRGARTGGAPPPCSRGVAAPAGRWVVVGSQQPGRRPGYVTSPGFFRAGPVGRLSPLRSPLPLPRGHAAVPHKQVHRPLAFPYSISLQHFLTAFPYSISLQHPLVATGRSTDRLLSSTALPRSVALAATPPHDAHPPPRPHCVGNTTMGTRRPLCLHGSTRARLVYATRHPNINAPPHPPAPARHCRSYSLKRSRR